MLDSDAIGPPAPDISRLSLGPYVPIKTAADGSPLEMAKVVPVPTGNPASGNPLDSSLFNKIIGGLHTHASQAEFPLRKTFLNPNTKVFTNHFAIKLNPRLPLYEYEIKGLPEKISKRTSKILVQNFINNTEFLKNHQIQFATDYKERIVSWVQFPKSELMPLAVSSKAGKDPISLWLLEKGTVNTGLLQQFSEGTAHPNKNVNDEIKLANKVLNMVISKSLSRDTFSLKANKFFITGGYKSLGASLCTMRGYFYSIKPGMGQILLNLNACTSAFYQPVLVSHFLMDDCTMNSTAERESALRGLKVYLTYEPKHSGNEKRSGIEITEACTKSIEGTGYPCSQQTFPLKGRNGQLDITLTVQEHFRRTYNINLSWPGLPAINCGTSQNPKWYPPELLQILPYQIFKRKVPDALTKNMLDVACHHPSESRTLIEHEGLGAFGLKPANGFVPFTACPPILIDSRMLEIPATVLPYPTPSYGSGKAALKDGKWNLNNLKFWKTNSQKSFNVFTIIVPSRSGQSRLRSVSADRIFEQFKVAAEQKYATARLTHCGATICPDFDYFETAKEVMTHAKNHGANFMILVLEKKSTGAYSVFKDLADRTCDMHSLCVVYREDSRSNSLFGEQYLANVAMKVNLKADGINHTVQEVSQVMKDTLVLGADVTHPGPSSLLGTPSIAAIVGSVDQHGGKFLGSMRLQARDTACEDIKDVEGMVFERIKAWYVQNGKVLPKNILYYRDGVSDSQYSQVKEHELSQIRKAFVAAAKDLKIVVVPKFNLTAIVVAKRHHVCFFPHFSFLSNAIPKNGNCRPGTLVNTAVTSPYFQDFYLQSHDGIKGTAKSAHYFILEHEMKMTEKDIQLFTHRLCYTYVRATMGVSYAPPAYYADRLCDRGRRCYLRNFLAPPPGSDHMKKQKEFRAQIDKHHKSNRDAKFSSRRTVDKWDKMTMKSAEEKQQEESDRMEVDKIVKAKTFEKASTEFYSNGLEKNPWKDTVGRTMFWM
ncbi:Piwi domain-containing protein [Pyrenochaeta sp. MPI-SDFR-AT-0127]|nr:Piwi domain-containing protein [Pyrenochaeta sp. MPI-SDFR-AT-0127]